MFNLSNCLILAEMVRNAAESKEIMKRSTTSQNSTRQLETMKKTLSRSRLILLPLSFSVEFVLGLQIEASVDKR